MHPPSPALSACDSLAGIEDLEAFLNSKGPLSCFPTPPTQPQEPVLQPCTAEDATSSDHQSRLDYHYAASMLLNARILLEQSTPANIVQLHAVMLARAGLPDEVLAIALNLLTAVRCRTLPQALSFNSQPDILVVAALHLAVSLTHDNPPPNAWWVKHVYAQAVTAEVIGRAVLMVFEALDWTIGWCAEPGSVRRAMGRLRRESADGPPRLKLDVENVATKWEFGQTTPEDSPLAEMAKGSDVSAERWLPLL